jgi:hypothetical protein
MVDKSPFGPPYDYCDVRCERCVFQRDCVIARELRNSRWLGDADVEESVLSFDRRSDAAGRDDLRRSPAGLQRLPAAQPMAQPFIERLRRAGIGYSLSLTQLLHELSAPFTEVFRDAEIAAALMAPKVARLTMSLRPGSEPAFDRGFAEDGDRTLLLLEHVDARTALALSMVCTECVGSATPFDRARVHLWEMLAPLSAQVPAHTRAELATLVVRGRAPSPFFVVSN